MDRIDKLKLNFFLIFRIILVLTGVVAVFNKDWINLALSVFNLFLTFLPSIIEKRVKIEYPSEGEIVILFFITASMYLGEVHDFYFRFQWWDLFLHFLAGLIFAGIGFSLIHILNRAKKLKLDPGFVSLFAFSFSLAMGVIWEIIEFTIDSLIPVNMQKSGLVDTMWDLIVNTIAALLIAIVAYLYTKGKIKHLSFYEKIKKKFIKLNPGLFKK